MPPKIPPFELTPAMREAAKQAREFAERPEIKALRGQIAGLRDSLDVPSLTVMAARIKASMEPAPVVRKPRRGRPHGSSPETKADKPLLAEMHDLIGAGKASSISDAAGRVAVKAMGNTHDQRVTRLRTKYVKRYGHVTVESK
jgi:hypothetical protein